MSYTKHPATITEIAELERQVRDLSKRLRKVAQRAIAVVGADGPEDAERAVERLALRCEQLAREVDEEHDTDQTLLHALIVEVLCRLPKSITGDRDWEQYLEEHGGKWLGDHRAFGGWLAGRIKKLEQAHGGDGHD